MVVVTAQFQAKAGKEEELQEAFKGMFPQVAHETGVVMYILHRSADSPGRFFFYEQYKDREAFDDHGRTPYFKDLFRNIKDLVTEPPVVEFLVEIDAIKR